MLSKIPFVYFSLVLFVLSLIGFAVIAYKPPLPIAMTFNACQILVGIIVIARGCAELKAVARRR